MLDAPCPIGDRHDLADFDCGAPPLDDWLRRRALANEFGGISRTYVITASGNPVVVGYVSLAAATILDKEATGAVRRNASPTIPAILIGRLAVDRRWQGRDVGRSLLQFAVATAIDAGVRIGVRAILVHAKDEAAAAWYRRRGFQPSAISPTTLMITTSAAAKAFAAPQ